MSTATSSQDIGAVNAKAQFQVNPEAIENSPTFGNTLIHGIDEIILPDAISYWPSAPGWWFVGAIVAVWLLIKMRQGLISWWRKRYRREALRQLKKRQHQAGEQLYDVVAVLPHYLKVTALQAYPREEVASLSGRSWLAFLDAHYSGPAFSKGVGEKLLVFAYRPREQWQLDEAQSRQLIAMARHWIRSHSEARDV